MDRSNRMVEKQEPVPAPALPDKVDKVNDRDQKHAKNDIGHPKVRFYSTIS